MQIIPLSDVPAQIVTAQLAGQSCRIDVRQKSTGTYLTLYRNDVLILAGVACRNWVRIIRDPHLGIAGDLCFVDTHGSDDPASPGIGSRFLLVYLSPEDYA